jgi:hypothetical protein
MFGDGGSVGVVVFARVVGGNSRGIGEGYALARGVVGERGNAGGRGGRQTLDV